MTARCPGCDRRTGWRKDGRRRRHRIHDDNVSPYCANGATT